MLAEYIYLECFATPSRQAGHCRVETLRDENANYISLIAHRLHELLFAGVPLGFGCRETIHNLLVVNENDINLVMMIEFGSSWVEIKTDSTPVAWKVWTARVASTKKIVLFIIRYFLIAKKKARREASRWPWLFNTRS